jgi:hypothetical protein
VDQYEHPLIASLHHAGTLSPYFDMPVVEAETGEWIRATDLFLGDNERLRHLVMSYGRETWGTPNNHVAASAFIIAYLTRLVYPAIGQYVLHRRVPRVSLENLPFHRTDRRIGATAIMKPSFAALRGDPAAGHLDVLIVPDEAAMYRYLEEWVFTSNVELVIGALHQAAQASVKVSQNAVAAACAQAFHSVYPLVEDPALVVRYASRVFEDPSSLIYRQIEMEVVEHGGKRGFFARRAGCCLAGAPEGAMVIALIASFSLGKNRPGSFWRCCRVPGESVSGGER